MATTYMKDYFAAQKWVLQVLGLSLSPNLNVVYKICSRATVIAMLIYILCLLPDLFNYERNFDDFIDSWMFGTGYCCVMIKVLTVYLNRSKLSNILNTLQSGVFVPNPKRGGKIERIWINKCVSFTRNLTVISTISGILGVLFCLVVFYLLYKNEGYNKLPFGSATILTDWDYKTTLFYHSFVYAIGTEAFMVVDSLYASILAHICVQCKILQNFIKRSIKVTRKMMIEEERCSSTECSKIPYKYLQRTIKEMVLHHMAIIKLAEDVEEVFNIPMLAVFTGMSVCFSFIMFQGSQYSFFEPNFFKDLIVFMAATPPLIVSSYWGSEVLSASQAIADACYEVDFVGTDIKFQKALVLIMQRSQRPIKLTVGKFAVLSLVTMVGVLRMSYSYFMLLRNVNMAS